MNINKYVGRKIREYRRKRGLSQTELGEKLGVKQNTVAGYEKGDWEVSYDNLFKLAEIFGVSIDDLFPPTTKSELNLLDKIHDVVSETSDLTYEDLLVIKKLTEKVMSLEGEDRKKLMDVIKATVSVFDKTNE